MGTEFLKSIKCWDPDFWSQICPRLHFEFDTPFMHVFTIGFIFVAYKISLMHITYILYPLWTKYSYFLGNNPEKGDWSKNVRILKKLCPGS